MQGHEQLIAMRLSGSAPVRVCIDTDAGALRNDRLWPFDPDHPQLHIGPDENVRRLDLRCLVGLTVQVGGCDERRVDAVVDACIRAKATRVIGMTHRPEGEGEFQTLPVIRVTDTTQEMTWQ